jgi:cyclic-di-GMP phosphodiesterase TipF (flagellum assembly factor)
MRLDGGDLAAASEFMPVRGGERIVRRIELMALEEAVVLSQRARGNKVTLNLYAPLSRATLGDAASVNQLAALLETNRAAATVINFAISEDDWRAATGAERQAMSSMVRRGAAFSIVNARSLRSDFSELSSLGVKSVRVDASRFIDQPEAFTDIHTSDIASFLERSGIDLMAVGIRSEDQIITLLEDGFRFAQGHYMAAAGPIRPDLVGDRLAPVA